MGLISSTHSISRYHIKEKIKAPVMERVRKGLIENSIPVMESEYDQISAGWTPFESPYTPDFNKFSFIFGTYFLFSLRIDKKAVPAKLVHKHMAAEIEKKKEKTGRDFISRNEKSQIRDTVRDMLIRKTPSVPSIYDVLWNYEESVVFLFTTQKAANELFETIFFKSFDLKPLSLFPYTVLETKSGFTPQEKDRVLSLNP